MENEFLTDEQIASLESQGDAVLSDKDISVLEADSKKYDRPIEAAAQGVARGLTFGLSDVAQTATGFRTGEELSKIKDISPTASLFGEVGGVFHSMEQLSYSNDNPQRGKTSRPTNPVKS